MEFGKEVTHNNLDRILKEESQLQDNIDVHREEHPQKIYVKSHDYGNKTIETILAEMKQRERQKLDWKNIHFNTKHRGVAGVSRQGIPVGY